MDKIEIDIIADILKSRLALHDFGIPVQKKLHEELAKVKQPTLFILSIRGANPMDYEFVNTSFNEIIKASLNDPHVFVVFKVDDGEFEELCTGIADIMEYKINNDSAASEILFQKAFTMLYIDENEKPMYIMPFDELHKKILKEITLGQISSKRLQEKFNIIAEVLSGILEDLLKGKFIIKVQGPEYIAVSNFI